MAYGFQGLGGHGIHGNELVAIRLEMSGQAIKERFDITTYPADVRPDRRSENVQRQRGIAHRNTFEASSTASRVDAPGNHVNAVIEDFRFPAPVSNQPRAQSPAPRTAEV